MVRILLAYKKRWQLQTVFQQSKVYEDQSQLCSHKTYNIPTKERRGKSLKATSSQNRLVVMWAIGLTL